MGLEVLRSDPRKVGLPLPLSALVHVHHVDIHFTYTNAGLYSSQSHRIEQVSRVSRVNAYDLSRHSIRERMPVIILSLHRELNHTRLNSTHNRILLDNYRHCVHIQNSIKIMTDDQFVEFD